MHIDVWADIACPWCYLGVRHLRAALASFEHREHVDVTFHAYFLDPELSERLDISEAEYLHHYRGMSVGDVRSSHERLEALGRAEGIVFDFDSLVVAPTAFAHKALAAAREYDLGEDTTSGADTTQFKLAEALYRARFEMGLDLSHPDVLIGCAQDIGMDAEDIVFALTDEMRSSDVFSDFQIAVQMGIDSVPTFLIDRRFVVQGAQPTVAMTNMLTSAWEHTAKEN